jgi:hypothetical protein
MRARWSQIGSQRPAHHGSRIDVRDPGRPACENWPQNPFARPDRDVLHVTFDITRGLHGNVHDSERIKTLYGSVLVGERMTVLTGGASRTGRGAAGDTRQSISPAH